MPPTYPDPDSALELEPDCERCPALVDCRNRISWGNGPADADVFVVGEAPGAGNPEADRWRGGNWTGMAYTARHSGRKIRELLAAAGAGDRAFYTNAVKCFPCDGEGSNREPSREELDNCRSHLRAELDAVDPETVVATGKHATATMLAFEDRSLDGFVDRVLDPVDLHSLGVTLVPVLHPAYQDVWLARLGYDPDEYREELAALLA